jgi:hypothetical protein
MQRLQPNPKSTLDAPWDPSLSKGSELTQFSVFFQAGLHHPVFTQVRTGGLVFNQGITHGDTLRGSDWDAQVIPKGICDTHPTLVDT